MHIGTPPADHLVDPPLVTRLLATQHPDLAELPLQAVDAGWDNAMFRLGDRLAVRLPRREAAAPLIMNEQDWLPRLAPQLTLPIPAPLRVGMPTHGYPWRWSVTPWIAGSPADLYPPSSSEAHRFAMFLRSLHTPAPANAPLNPVRGVPLTLRAEAVALRMARLAQQSDVLTPRIHAIWDVAVAAPIDTAPTWLHGDLHPRNLLTENGAITGVIDWGDITAGDRATDLAAIWMLFDDANAQAAALNAYANVSEATVQRAKGWAVLFSVMLLDTGLVDNPRNAAIGARTLARLQRD